ncbi:unnamed protein product [Acanthoscelides obtectus]|uniref:Uncharacterized protein n=1 Tax=Acanthoscelides obtectus TaxID=200917 RepID=A0A9P0VPR4_ACAOB|nr:unnamed protein product [Acanthoscelides obtectus]CAK1627179.1 hypothetical protein AOBTE_LOCUS4362 [Acanthoscelides obtectus]
MILKFQEPAEKPNELQVHRSMIHSIIIPLFLILMQTQKYHALPQFCLQIKTMLLPLIHFILCHQLRRYLLRRQPLVRFLQLQIHLL